jgi:ubiquinone/menaquinone biosynthesis C-methylase UbiE
MRPNFLLWGSRSEYFDLAERYVHGCIKLIDSFLTGVDVRGRAAVDLGCGRGRLEQYLRRSFKTVLGVDVNRENIDYCSQHKTYDELLETDGMTIPVSDASVDYVFCFDTMVHFDVDVVHSYLKQTKRVLIDDGLGFFHHSNIITCQIDISKNPHYRNCMNKTLFAYLANIVGLHVVKQLEIDWDGCNNLDCLTLVKKSNSGRL